MALDSEQQRVIDVAFVDAEIGAFQIVRTVKERLYVAGAALLEYEARKSADNKPAAPRAESQDTVPRAVAERIAALETENAALKAPVSDEEWLALCSGDVVTFADVLRRDVDALIANRAKETP